jgi:glycosyltransferase involved in cell wall biosynthesis
MRILMISDVCFPRVNGVSTSIQTFRDDLTSLGHYSLLIAPEYAETATAAAEHETLRIASRGVPRDPEDRFMSKKGVLATLPQLRAAHFDVVHVQTPFVAHYAGVALGKQLGLPVVETYHTYFEHYLHHYVPALPSGLMRWVARRFTRAQCASVAAVISPSRAMAEALRDYGVATRIDILPTGLDTGRFESGDAARFRARHGIDPNRPIALFVGRVAHEKNIDFLLRMFVRVREARPDALLIIAGEGPAQPHCRTLAQQLQLGESVKFIGYMDRNSELLDCYRAADAFVFASRTETQGLVLLEALAQGTPVVSTAVMGTIDVLQGTRGSIVVDEDEQRFAAAVVEVIADPVRRAELAAHARADALAWSSRAMAQRLVNIYTDVIESSQVRNASVLTHGDTDAHGKHLATARRSG